MSGLDVLVAKHSERTSPPCKVAVLLAALDKADQLTLADALADAAIPISALVRALKEQSFGVSDSTLRKHRRGLCPCR